MSKRTAALALAASGFRVFPLVANGKTPQHEGNWRKAATTDPARVAEMWTCPVTGAERDYNIGIATGDGLMVYDEDTKPGKHGDKSTELLEAIYDDLPATRTHRTATGGRHRLYRAPHAVPNSAGKIATDIDIRGDGGFIVGPGSEIDGVAYAADDAPIADAPEWLLTLAGTAKDRPAGTAAPLADLDTDAAIARATEYLARAPESVEGAGGDATAYTVAAKVGEFGVSEDTCLDLMLDHWNERCSPPWMPEDLAVKVRNAYTYRQDPVGVAAPEAEFEPVAIDLEPAKEPAKRRGLYAIRWADAVPDFDQPYLIDDVMDLGSMVVTYGDSNTGKTYVVADQAFHIAAGKDWNGHKVTKGLVVYVASEGGKGFMKRVQALKQRHGVTDLPFCVVPCPLDLQGDVVDANRLIKIVRDEEAYFGEKCVLVVIDTLARAMGGGDENTATDMGKFVGHSDRLRAALGCTINIVHHTGKDKSKGARGSSALRAATDTEIEIDHGVVAVTKQRDMAAIKPLRFELVGVEVGARQDGKVVTACVVEWKADSEFVAEVSPAAEEMFEVLERMVAEAADAGDTGDEKRDKVDVLVPWSEWQNECLNQLKGARGKKITRQRLFDLRRELSDSRRIKKDAHNQWGI